MGEAIPTSSFEPADYEAFRRRVQRELAILDELVEREDFGAGETSIGAEVEMALIDTGMRPARVNEDVLRALGDEAGPGGLAPELDRFCVELDTPPVFLEGEPFAAIERAMQAGFEGIFGAAATLDTRPVLIGTLPTVRLDDLAPSVALTPEPRFAALGAGLSRNRQDDRIEIEGVERLSTEIRGIATEGIMAALQVHLKVPPERFARTLNAAHLATAPVLGASGNSPFVLGRSLWVETRVPLLRQVVDGSTLPPGRPSRVALGHGWLHGPATELFHEDAAMHPPLLPVRYEDEQATDSGTPVLPALRLHAGSVWRWNRPVFDPTGPGHVRMELRALPSGPTVTDMAANAAFLIGATLALADDWDLPAAMPFGAAIENLDAAARNGLDAEILWPARASPSPVPRRLVDVAAELLPAAARALEAQGVARGDVEERLEVVARRIETGQTGSAWQRAAVAAREPAVGREQALVDMVRAFADHSAEGRPVAEWPPPERA